MNIYRRNSDLELEILKNIYYSMSIQQIIGYYPVYKHIKEINSG